MPGYTGVALATLALVAAAGTLIIAYSMYRLLKVYPSRSLEYALAGFIFFSLAQILAAVSYIVEAARLAYALFVASTAASLSSYLLIYQSTRASRRRIESPLLFAGGLTLPAVLDILAAMLAAGVSIRSMHRVKLGFALISLAHLARAVAVSGGASGYLYLLFTAEVVRVAAVALLVLYYAGRVLGVGSKV